MALYDIIGQGYASLRRPDPRLARLIHTALADSGSVINVGAGAGSYEPADREVLAVEPSEVMIRQRPAGSAPCVQGRAESLPVATASMDAAMAILSAHHWSDLSAGLSEMARVSRHRVILLTWVPGAAPFWLTEDYFPEILMHDRTIFPTEDKLRALCESVVGATRISPVPIPHDCVDGMLCAYWRRPERYLAPEVRAAISSFSEIDADPGLAKLREDLASGRWLDRNRDLLLVEALDLGYRLVTCDVRR